MAFLGIRYVALLAVVVSALPSTAAAQIDAPSLPMGGIFGRRNAPDPKLVSQEMTVTLNAGIGHDRNVAPTTEVDPLTLFGPQQSGRLSFGAAAINYRWGRDTRFLEANSRGYASYAAAGLNQVWNGSAAMSGAIDVTPRVQLTVSGSGEISPVYLFEFLTTGSDELAPPVDDSLHPQGVTEQKWLAADGAAGLHRTWTTRQRSSFQYAGAQTRPLEGSGLDNRWQLGSFHHSWKAKRTLGFQFSYRIRENRQEAEFGGENTLLSHSVDAGLDGSRRLSAVRSINYSVAVGVTHANAEYVGGIPSRFVMPNFSGGIGLRMTRSWLISAYASRNLTVLEGFSPEPLAVNTISLDLSGNLSRRLQLRTTGNVSKGDSKTGAGAFDNSTASVHAQYALSRSLAMFAGYGYYEHHLRNLITALAAFPDRYSRHSTWLGMSVWMPVFGRF